VLLWLLLPDKKGAGRPFDIFGFLILAMGLVSLQLLFDRGERIDWFSSKEAWIELAIAVSSFWILAIHIFTSDRTIWPKAMITDRNVLTGAIFMFVVGLIALAVMALLPPLLQGIYRYSVMDAGILLSSRGIGVVITMALVGRIIGFTDPRVLAALGIFLVAVSLWLMTGWAIDQGWQHVVTSGLIQGFGLGLVFVPMNVISFATISSAYRTDAAAFINLWRNIGSSLGVSIMAAMLARNIQVSHADLAQHITGERVPVDPTVATALGDSGIPILSLVDAEITRQATMIAFLDDFKLMAIACVFVIPLLLFIKPVNRTAGPSTPLME
jgi:DHA2 family multidrug resistance protein